MSYLLELELNDVVSPC